MFGALIRRLIREELEGLRRDMAEHLAGLVARNNEQIEEDLVRLGVLERDENGELHRNPCRS